MTINPVSIKRNDVGYLFNCSLVNDDGSIPNLTGATVKFNMGTPTAISVSNPATIVNATSGEVSYQFTSQDTLNSGSFIGEFQVTFSNGNVLSYPRSGYIAVNIQANVDTALSNVTVDAIAAREGDFTTKLNNILANNSSFSEVIDARGTFTTLGSRLNNVDSEISTNTAQLADIMSNQGWINPDKYSGTDAQKLQSALNDSDSKGEIEIVLSRQYDITGSTLKVNRQVYGRANYIKITGLNGGITKNDAGFIFSSDKIGGNYTERVKVQNCKFVSTAGAGTKVFDFDSMLEVTCSNNQYINVDTVAFSSGNNAQSPRFLNENINGGNGYAFDFVNLYDFLLDDSIIEQREALFIVRSSAPIAGNVNPNGNGANQFRITNNLIEGMTGTESVIKLGFTSVGEIKGNYFETNKGTDIDLSQNPSYGVTVSDNFIHSTDATKTCILLPTVAVKSNNQSDKYLFMSNHVRGGATMYGFPSAPDPVINILSINDVCINGTFISNYANQVDIYGSFSELKSTTTGNTQYNSKNGVKKYKIAWDDGGVTNGTTKACSVDVGYSIGANALLSVNIKKATDGTNEITPASTRFISDLQMNASDATKLNFTMNNQSSVWARTYYDITIIDF